MGPATLAQKLSFCNRHLNVLTQALRCLWIVSTLILFYAFFFNMKSCKNTIQESIKPLSLSTNSLHRPNAVLPEAIKYLPIWLDPQHDIVCGGVVDEGTLGVDEEHVGDPDLLHQSAIKGHALVVGAGEGQPLVFPVVPQIKRHGEVLQQTGFCHNLISIAVIAPLWDKP